MKICAALTLIVLAIAPTWLAAEVADSSASGFTVKITITIQASPEEVYCRLVRNVGDWWSPEHTYSHDPHNLSIEEKAMGCFCEKWAKGNVRHMEVVNLQPGKVLVLTGALGPLQSLAASGNMRISLSPAVGGTKLEATYAVFGYLPQGVNTWAAPVDSVLTEQFTRLKTYVEGGAAALKPPPSK